jgi:hypothetical protein
MIPMNQALTAFLTIKELLVLKNQFSTNFINEIIVPITSFFEIKNLTVEYLEEFIYKLSPSLKPKEFSFDPSCMVIQRQFPS